MKFEAEKPWEKRSRARVHGAFFAAATAASLVMAGALPLTTGSAQAADSSTSHLLASYDFQDGTARDTTGHGYDLTLENGAAIESYGDKPAGSLALSTRGGSQYAAFPEGMFDQMDEFTLVMNMKNRSTTGNFFTFAIGQDTDDYLYLRTRFDELYAGITTASWQHESGLTVPLDTSIEGIWHQIALVVTPDLFTLYLDGKPVGSTNAIDASISDLGKGLKAYLGRSFYGPDAYFDGAFDDIEVWDTALTPEDLLGEGQIQVADTTQVLAQSVNITNDKHILDVTLDYWAPGGEINGETTDASDVSLSYVVPTGSQLTTPDGGVADDIHDYSQPVELTLTDENGESVDYEVRVHTLVTPLRIPGAKDATGTMGMKFFADPQIFVDDGKYYIYPTTDGHSGWAGWQIHAFVSEDLAHWRDAGVVIDLHDQNLDGTPDSDVLSARTEHAWAPAMAKRDGKYYLYFSGDGQTNVAVSDSPDSGFTLTDKTVSSSIDPAVFEDPQTGKWYYAWGQSGIQYAELNEDMVSYDPSTRYTQPMQGYREASYIVARQYEGEWTYYYLYSVDDTNSPNYHIAYATATSMAGPWTYRGSILDKDVAKGILGTGHNSIIQVPGTDTWYTAYHAFLTDSMRPRLIDQNTGDRIATGNKRETRLAQVRFTEPTAAEVAAGEVPLIKTIPVDYEGVQPEEVPNVTITGDGSIGSTLTASFNSTWSATSWQWLRDGTAIAGATGESYTLTGADSDATIAVEGTAESTSGVKNNAGTAPARTEVIRAEGVKVPETQSPLTMDVTTRCLASRPYLVTTVGNGGETSTQVTIDSVAGSRAVTVAEGKKASASFAIRTQDDQPITVAASAVIDGEEYAVHRSVDGESCS